MIRTAPKADEETAPSPGDLPVPASQQSLQDKLSNAAFAFRGYNLTNLGRTPELLAHSLYGPTVARFLEEGSEIYNDTVRPEGGGGADLVARMRNRTESTLETYPEDIALIMAVELAQIDLLEKFFDVRFCDSQFAFGYSLGEVTAVVAAGVYPWESALRPLVELAADAAELAQDIRLGVLFSRGERLDLETVHQLCQEVTASCEGVVDISTYLSPNSVILLGQRDSLESFRDLLPDRFPGGVHLKLNPHRWPPMHTSITWQRNIPNRAGVMLQQTAGGFDKPCVPLLSCVTGEFSYDANDSRQLLTDWVDHPQRVWDVVSRTLQEGTQTVLHLGPDPNILPATFTRLSNNVSLQLKRRSFASLGKRAVSQIVRRRPWLSRVLSREAHLLRAPFVEQVTVENWLLERKLR